MGKWQLTGLYDVVKRQCGCPWYNKCTDNSILECSLIQTYCWSWNTSLKLSLIAKKSFFSNFDNFHVEMLWDELASTIIPNNMTKLIQNQLVSNQSEEFKHRTLDIKPSSIFNYAEIDACNGCTLNLVPNGPVHPNGPKKFSTIS